MAFRVCLATVKSILIGFAIALWVAAPAGAHYDFGWGFSAVNGDPSIHSVKGSGDAWETEYDFLTERCRPDIPTNEQPWNSSESPDEAVRVFRFTQRDGVTKRLSMNLAYPMRNARWIGSDFTDFKREQAFGEGHPEYRRCGSGATIQERRATDHMAVYRSRRPIATYGGPWEFDMDEWVTSPYYVSPNTGPTGMSSTNPAVYALVHVEFHGNRYPSASGDPITEYCPSNIKDKCWMATVTMAKSVAPDQSVSIPNRLGASYGEAGTQGTAGQGGYRAGKNSLVANLPQQYIPDWGYRGPAAFTNVIKHTDGYYYIVVGMTGILDGVAGPLVDPDGATQELGKCVLRTTNLNDATSWRGWDGTGFNTRWRSPYQGADPYPWSAALTVQQRMEQICKPVDIGFSPRQVTYNENLKKYMLMGRSNATDADSGIYYSLSDDLINWSPAQLLLRHPRYTDPGTGKKCEVEDGLEYGVVIDPDDSASVADPNASNVNTNFDHPDRTAYLYASREFCPVGIGGKDLVRTPIKFMQRSATLEPPTGPSDTWPSVTQNDYDTTSGIWFSKLNTGAGYGYGAPGDSWTGLATSWPYGNVRAAYGEHTARWSTGDDVWYGSAFKVPNDFVANNAGVQIMSWHTASSSVYGGIALDGADNQWHMVRGSSSSSYIGQPFDLPTGRWTWVEVHQKLGISAGGGTLTEVFVDGKLVSTTDSANRADSSAISAVRYGIVWNNTVGGPSSTQAIEVDRSSMTGGQLGAVVGDELYQAPLTPIGLRTTPDDTTHISLAWNGVTGVAGYRVYEQQSNGTWSAVGSPVTGNSVRLSVSSCSTHTYRITAYRDYGADPLDWTESGVSMPLVAQPDNC